MIRRKKPVTLQAVRPSVGFQVAYQKRLDALIAQMQAEIVREVDSAWKANPPELAQDRSPAAELRRLFAKLGRKWQRRFDRLAPELAAHFATEVGKRSDASLKASLRKAGFTVQFRMTRAQNDALQATIGENVSLIGSIPAQHLAQVEGSVMRSVAAGRDLGTLSRDLQEHFGVTKRRAATIARDQNNKATATLARTRYIELGITEAIWLHSAGGKHPRPSHVAFNGKRFDVRTGAYLDGEWLQPGQAINCRCVSRPIIPGLERQAAA